MPLDLFLPDAKSLSSRRSNCIHGTWDWRGRGESATQDGCPRKGAMNGVNCKL